MVRVSDLMTVDLVTAAPEMTLREVAELLAQEHISGVPVVSQGRVHGVISATDLMEFEAELRPTPPEEPADMQPALAEADSWSAGDDAPAAYFADYWDKAATDVGQRFNAVDGLEWNTLEEHVASELMTRTVCSVEPETPARDAAEYMLRAGVHRVLVSDRGKLVGVVTTTDLVKAVSQYDLGG